MIETMDRMKEEHKKSKKDFKGKYFIKDIENLTGIKAYTLRIWEQRYGLLIPKRTDTNIRYYEDDDLRFMMNISILNANGYKISRIAKMTQDEIKIATSEIAETNYKHDNLIQSLSNSMLDFDEKEFNKILSISILKIGMEDTMAQVIFPFMHHVGMLWISGAIHVSHEHFITNLIRQRLYVALDQLGPVTNSQSEKYLLFVPNGENHDLGLLFASYLLRARGQQVIYLGTSTPMDDLSQIFKFRKADVVFCTITNSQQSMPVEVFVKTVSRVFKDARIVLSGNQVLRLHDTTLPANCTIVNNIDAFKNLIEQRIKVKNAE